MEEESGSFPPDEESKSSLNISMSSGQSGALQLSERQVRKQRRAKARMSKVFRAWRKYTYQVAEDKRLFFKIREFIITRLQRGAFKMLKLNYITMTLVNHYRRRHFIGVKRDCILGWKAVIQQQRVQSVGILKIAEIFDKANGFLSIIRFSELKRAKQQKYMRSLVFWSRNVQKHAFNILLWNISARQTNRENAFKALIFEERRLKYGILRLFRENLLSSKVQRVLKYKALIKFSKSYISKGFSALRWFVAYRKYLLSLEQRKLLVDNNRDSALVKRSFNGMRNAKQLSLQKASHIADVLVKIAIVHPAYSIMKANMQQQIQIENDLTCQRALNKLRKYRQYKVKVRQNIEQLKLKQHENSLRFALNILRDAIKFESKQTQIMGKVLTKLQIRQAFRLMFRISKVKKGIVALEKSMNMHYQRQGFRLLKLSVKLQVLNDELISRIQFRQRFQDWKEIAFEDKRISKMMIRAGIHRNRVLRRKIFLIFKRQILPQFNIMPSRVRQLKYQAFKMLKANRIKKRVRDSRHVKADRHYRQQLLSMVLTHMRQVTFDRMVKNQAAIQAKRQIETNRNRNILKSVLNAIKNQAYVGRVREYLNQKTKKSILSMYFAQMRESFIRVHASQIKEERAAHNYRIVRLHQCLLALYNNRQSSVTKKYRVQQACHYRAGVVQRKCLTSLYQVRMKGIHDRQLMKQALDDSLKEKLQRSLIKLVKVGIYWAQIKGRFGQQGKNSRIYLGLKYGLRWRAYTLISRFSAQKQQSSSIQLKGTPELVTSKLKQQLLPKVEAKVVINRSQIIQPQQMTVAKSLKINTSLQVSQSQGSMSRTHIIEAEILAFKNKKLLLKELEDQYKQLASSPQTSNVAMLMKSKIDGLRNELIQMQPVIRDMLNEIALLKRLQQNGQDSTFALSSTNTPMAMRSPMSNFRSYQ